MGIIVSIVNVVLILIGVGLVFLDVIVILIGMTSGVLDYHTEDLLRREDCILSTRFARMDPTECFFVFRLDRRRRWMTDRWQCESTCF